MAIPQSNPSSSQSQSDGWSLLKNFKKLLFIYLTPTDTGTSPASFSASFDALVSSYHMSREQMNGLLEGLMANEDDSTQLICLQTVCDFLSIASEGVWRGNQKE